MKNTLNANLCEDLESQLKAHLQFTALVELHKPEILAFLQARYPEEFV